MLSHLGHAQTNQSIARLMKVPETTAKGLVRIVLAKLNLMNRTEAAIFAVRFNLSSQTWPVDGGTLEADPSTQSVPA